ncbi:ABC transporter substrate-binding protein [Desulfococcaceae bacterium HSG9]|nr:ABC transporter substrate-binding protein [Desulfococcaceae bacterium HSG9]
MESQNDPFKEGTLYIALVASDSGIYKASGTEAFRGVRLYIDQVNQAGGIDGRKIELRSFDDQGDVDSALRIASKIASSDNILTVIGHTDSETSIVASLIYKKAEIPVITASTTSEKVTAENDWCFRITPSYASWGDFSANYIKKALKKNKVSIIYTRNQLGFEMVKNFEETAQMIGLEIKKEWSLEPEEHSKLYDNMEPVLEELEFGYDPGMIFIAAQKNYFTKIINLLKTLETDYPILAIETLYIDDVYTNYDETLKAMEGVLMVSPFLTGGANIKAQTFKKDYRQKYKEEPSAVAAVYYDAIMMVAEAVKKAKLQGKRQIRRHRRMVRAALVSSYNRNNAVHGVTGDIFFNTKGDVSMPLVVGLYENQKFIPNFSQYHFISDIDSSTNLLQMYLNEKIILVNDQVMVPTQVVQTNFSINSISNLDIENSSYTVDFLLTFRFKGEFDPSEIIFAEAVKPLIFAQPLIEKKDGDVTYKLYHFPKAAFKGDFDFHQYPFNRPVLTISFHHANRGQNSLIYLRDSFGVSVLPESIILENSGEWNVSAVSYYQDIISNVSSLGIPDLFDAQATRINYSQFNADIEIKRTAFNQDAQKYFVPLLIMSICLLSVLYKPVSLPWLRILTIMAVLVANTYYHIYISSNFPVEYIMRLEYNFLAIYILAFIVMFILLFKSTLTRKNK